MKHVLFACGVALCAHIVIGVESVEKTMVVARCQAVLKDGRQCSSQAEQGSKYCWRHRGVVKSVNEAVESTGKGANAAWQSTRNWSTNAWHKTQRGAQEAWQATKDAAEEAREEFVDLFGGKKATEKKQVK